MTPHEAYFGKKSDVAHLQEWGCNVWVLDETMGRSKLAPKASKMVFVGFMEGSKSVRYYDARTHQVKVSHNIAFSKNAELVNLPGLGVEEEMASKHAKESNKKLELTVNTESGSETHMDPQPLQTPAKETPAANLPTEEAPLKPYDHVEPPKITTLNKWSL